MAGITPNEIQWLLEISYRCGTVSEGILVIDDRDDLTTISIIGEDELDGGDNVLGRTEEASKVLWQAMKDKANS